MSKIEDNFLKLSTDMKGFMGSIEEKLNSSTQKPSSSLPLSKLEIKAFQGLCAMEGKSLKDKIAELIQNYLEEKRKQMEQ